MIITKLLRFVGGNIYTLASKSEGNPKKANAIALLSTFAGSLMAKDVSTGLADVLLYISEVLRAL